MDVIDPAEHLCGACIEGRFTLDAFLARGGYGAVYRGTHQALGCPVAVKVLAVPERYQGSARERFIEVFEREARIVAALRHPAVVRVLDFGVTSAVDPALPFMVLEWIEGVTLDTALGNAPRRRSPREAFALLRPVFDAIASAHAAGVVHRDLKPANVMVERSHRGDDSARVLDFGVAKVMRPDEVDGDVQARTGDEFSSFSLSHAAPEQIGQLRTGPWTDVHALALLLVEVLVGERAYRGQSNVALFASITAVERPTPRTFGVEVGPWEAALARALALTPTDRHRDAEALLVELDEGLDAAQRAWEGLDAPVQPAAAPARWRRAALVVAAVLAVLAPVWGLTARAPRRPRSSPAVVAPTVTPTVTAPVATPPPTRTLAVPSTPPPSTPTPAVRRAPAHRATVVGRRPAPDDEIVIE